MVGARGFVDSADFLAKRAILRAQRCLRMTSSNETAALGNNLGALLRDVVVEEGERRVRGDEWILERHGSLPPRYGLSMVLDPSFGGSGMLHKMSSLEEASSASSSSSSSRRVSRVLVDLLRTFTSQLSDAIIEWSDFAGEVEASDLQARTLEILSSLVALTRWYACEAGGSDGENAASLLGLPVQPWSLHDIAGSFGLQFDATAEAAPQSVHSTNSSSSGDRVQCLVEDDLTGLLLSLLRKLLLFPTRTASTTTASAVLECQVLHVLVLLARGISTSSVGTPDDCDFMTEFSMSDGPTVVTRMLARNSSGLTAQTQALQALLVLQLSVHVAELEHERERGSWDLTVQLGGAVGMALRAVLSHGPASSAPVAPLVGRVRLWTPRSFGEIPFPSQVWPWAGSSCTSSSPDEAAADTSSPSSQLDGPSSGFYITQAMQQEGAAILKALTGRTEEQAEEGVAGVIAKHLLSAGPSRLLSNAWDLLFRLVCPEPAGSSNSSSSSSSGGGGGSGGSRGARKAILLAVVDAVAAPVPAGVSVGGMPLAHLHFTLFALRLLSTLGADACRVLRDGGCTSLLARLALQSRPLPGGECLVSDAGIATEWLCGALGLGGGIVASFAATASSSSSSLVDPDLPPVGLTRSQSLPLSDRAAAPTQAQVPASSTGLEAYLLRDLQWEALRRCVVQGGPAEIDLVLTQIQLGASTSTSTTSTSTTSSSSSSSSNNNAVANIPEDVLAQALAWLPLVLRLAGADPMAEGLAECYLAASRTALLVARAQLVATGASRERVERGGSVRAERDRVDQRSVHHTPPRTTSESGGSGGAGLMAPPGASAVASSRRGSSASGAALTGYRPQGSTTPLSTFSGASSPRAQPYHWHARARALRLLQALASGTIHTVSRFACADAFLPSSPATPPSSSASIPASASAVISASNVVLRLCLDPRYRPAALDVLSSLLHTCAGSALEGQIGRGSADDAEGRPMGAAVCPYEPLAHDVLKSMLALVRAAPRIAIRTRGATLQSGAAGFAEGGVRYLCTPYEDHDSFGA